VGRSAYDDGRMARRLAIWWIALSFGTCAAIAGPAELGARFADAYSAFAPLFALYRSYADHLFEGTDVAVPPEIGGACEAFPHELASLYIDLVVQTPPATAETMTRLVHLRSDTAVFCDTYGATLEAIAAMDPVDLDRLKQASRDRLFATINAMNDRLEGVFSSALDGIGDGVGRWRFAVAFAVRSILRRGAPDRIDSNIAEILYGGEGRTAPPIDVPADVSDAMVGLVEASGRALSPGEAEAALTWALRIEAFLLGDAEGP